MCSHFTAQRKPEPLDRLYTNRGVHLREELGSIEAPWLLKLDKLGPFVVDMDCKGNNLYDEVDKTVAINKQKAYSNLGISPEFEYTKLY